VRQVITRVEDELHVQLKEAAAARGMSVNAFVVDALTTAVGATSKREAVRRRAEAAGRRVVPPGSGRGAELGGRRGGGRRRRHGGERGVGRRAVRPVTTGVYYADTSALVRAYVSGEPHHAQLRRQLLDGDVPVVTSVLTRVEFASAVAAAGRAGRLRRPRVLLDRFDADCRENGPVTLLDLDTGTAFRLARRLVREHPLPALDAIHLAVALTEAVELAAGDLVSLVTCDKAQAIAADAVGLPLA
jgi:uncharacterized protein